MFVKLGTMISDRRKTIISSPGQSLPSHFVDTLATVRYPDLTAISEGRYTVRMARYRGEIESALRLRNQVFNVELGSGKPADENGLEFDAFDFKCCHLIVIDGLSGSTVGTYRLNSIETAVSVPGFYSANEFTIEDLPFEVLADGLEIGRACVAREHRNTKVLFLLWKGLLAYLRRAGKRYCFGCCSIFTTDPALGRTAFRNLIADGFLDSNLRVEPCRNGLRLAGEGAECTSYDLPALFKMYLRIGARVCGPPMIDTEFGTIDFFVVFDLTKMSPKFRRMFC